MEPIAMAIDNLQSTNDHYAAFLPTLHGLRGDFQALKSESLAYCTPLLNAVEAGFDRRFARFFDLNDEQCQAATIAACVHPHFKMRWIHPDFDENIDKIQDIIVKAALEKSETVETATQIKDENNSKFCNHLDNCTHIFYISNFFFQTKTKINFDSASLVATTQKNQT